MLSESVITAAQGMSTFDLSAKDAYGMMIFNV
jgi:hypothetical protein